MVRYLGSKARIAEHIIPLIMKKNTGGMFVEPFVGSASIMENVVLKDRWANDANKYLIAMYVAIQDGWIPPQTITEEEYFYMRDHKDEFPDHLVGFIGIGASFGGMWWHTFARDPKNGRDTCGESHRSVLKQKRKLKGVKFTSLNYKDLDIQPGSLVYCDPPYANTQGYTATKDTNFNHDEFWQWVRDLTKHSAVFASEYTAPSDFVPIWKNNLRLQLAKDRSKEATEHLFVHESQLGGIEKAATNKFSQTTLF